MMTYYESAADAITACSVEHLLKGNSILLQYKTEGKRSHQSYYKDLYCASAIEDGELLEGTGGCNCHIHLRDSKHGWYVQSVIPHSEECMRRMKIIRPEIAAELMRRKLGLMESLKKQSSKTVREFFESQKIETHVDGLYACDKKGKYMFFSRIADAFNESKYMSSNEGYNTLESLLQNFTESNPGSVYTFETEMIKGEKRFKRAFLLCSQFVHVAATSDMNFYAIDAGNLRYLLLYISFML